MRFFSPSNSVLASGLITWGEGNQWGPGNPFQVPDPLWPSPGHLNPTMNGPSLPPADYLQSGVNVSLDGMTLPLWYVPTANLIYDSYNINPMTNKPYDPPASYSAFGTVTVTTFDDND